MRQLARAAGQTRQLSAELPGGMTAVRTRTRAKGTGTLIPEAKVADPPGLPPPPTAGQKVGNN